MDMHLNHIPESIRTIHLIAVCGTAMGALAALLKQQGYAVTGSDANVYPPMSDFLDQHGIPVMKGFDPRHIDYRPDLVVVGNAVTRENPEARTADRLGLAFCSLPQAVNRFLGRERRTLMVAGTHGKTTTSALLAWVLDQAGLDPSFLIGGILGNYDSNFRIGGGRCFVVEGDEYDTAFFDKGPKFLHYQPHVTVITGIEFDHADIYRDLDHVRRSFRRLIAGLHPDSLLIAAGEDDNLSDLLAAAPCRVQTYGQGANCHWQFADSQTRPPRLTFTVHRHGRPYAMVESPLPGRHNQLNTLAVAAAIDAMGVSAEQFAAAVAGFKGIRRRQEVRGSAAGVTVIDDFAHHPTAVRETVAAIGDFYPNRRLLAVFEPRTNSSMRNVFQSVYPTCFAAADIVYVREPSRLDKIPATERFSAERLVDDLTAVGKDARFFPDTDTLLDDLLATVAAGDVVLIMSNGGFDNIHAKLLESLRSW